MKEMFIALKDAITRGESSVLFYIIASSGSTPRGAGAMMAAFENGAHCGTVGGGAVEAECVRRAKAAFADKKGFTEDFNLAPNQTADIGMICGGRVRVCFQFLAGGDLRAAKLLCAICTCFERDADAWLITGLSQGAVRAMDLYEAGRGLLIGDVASEAEVLPLLSGKATLRTEENPLYVLPIQRAGLVYVFGGGHVSKELAPLLAHLSFRVAVYEDRAEFADPALFPGVQKTILAPYTEMAKRIEITERDAVVIMTRGHQSDFEVLAQALFSPAAYVGVIGSRHKIEATNRRLIEAGVPEAALARIHTPIGLAIKAETPAEIAVSIAAELILFRASR